MRARPQAAAHSEPASSSSSVSVTTSLTRMEPSLHILGQLAAQDDDVFEEQLVLLAEAQGFDVNNLTLCVQLKQPKLC